MASSLFDTNKEERQITPYKHAVPFHPLSLLPIHPLTSSCPSSWLAAQRRALTGRWEQGADLCLRGNSGSPVFSCPPPTTSSCSAARLPLPPAGPPSSPACSQWGVDIVSWWKMYCLQGNRVLPVCLTGYCWNIKARRGQENLSPEKQRHLGAPPPTSVVLWETSWNIPALSGFIPLPRLVPYFISQAHLRVLLFNIWSCFCRTGLALQVHIHPSFIDPDLVLQAHRALQDHLPDQPLFLDPCLSL